MGRTRITLPKPKVRKGEKARLTKVHEVGHKVPEPTVQEGLDEWFYQDESGDTLSVREGWDEEEGP